MLVLISILIFLLILALIKISVQFSFAFEDKPKGLELKIQYLFIKKTIIPAPIKNGNKKSEEEKTEKNKKENTSTIKMIYYLVRKLKDDIFKLLEFLIKKTVKVENFTLESNIGASDPMLTGIAIGAANGFIYNLLSLLDRHRLLKQFSVSINPDWENIVFRGGLYVEVYTNIFTVLRLAFIASGIGLKALWLMKKYKKGI
jgi:hypothetical protein